MVCKGGEDKTDLVWRTDLNGIAIVIQSNPKKVLRTRSQISLKLKIGILKQFLEMLSP